MNGKVLSVLFLLYIGYVALGGIIFYYIEVGFGKTRFSFDEPLNDTVEAEIQECGLEVKLEHLTGICNVSYAREELIEFIENVENCTKGEPGPPFDIPAAMYFAGTISTTIGYGHITPSGKGGKIFTIVFAIFGVPFCLVILAALGEKLRIKLKKFCSILKLQSKSWSDKTNASVLSIFILILGTILFLLIPAAIFTVLEKWSYLDSIYFCFVTLSTVGFGDYVSGLTHTGIVRGLYMLCTGLWTYIGLAWLATCFTSFFDLYTKLIERAEAKMDIDLDLPLSGVVMDGNLVNASTQTDDFTVTVVTANGIMRYQNGELNAHARQNGHPPRYSELVTDGSEYGEGSIIESSQL